MSGSEISNASIKEDGDLNILDIVLIVNLILSNELNDSADINDDGILNVLDIVQLVNCVVEENCENLGSSCIDYDGNIYETVVIGNQLWMAENLRVTQYNNGDQIEYEVGGEDWEMLLVEKMADEFNKQRKKGEIRKIMRPMARMKQTAEIR